VDHPSRCRCARDAWLTTHVPLGRRPEPPVRNLPNFRVPSTANSFIGVQSEEWAITHMPSSPGASPPPPPDDGRGRESARAGEKAAGPSKCPATAAYVGEPTTLTKPGANLTQGLILTKGSEVQVLTLALASLGTPAALDADMAKGDHIEVSRSCRTYHAIDCGDGCVAEFSGKCDEGPLSLRVVTLDVFTDGNEYRTVHCADPVDADLLAWLAASGVHTPRLGRASL